MIEFPILFKYIINNIIMEKENMSLDHQDWAVKIIHKSKKPPVKKQVSSSQKIDKQNDEGNYKTKRMDSQYGKIVQSKRQSLGLTQKDLATKICVNHRLIIDIEAGKSKHNPQIMNKLNNYFNKNMK